MQQTRFVNEAEVIVKHDVSVNGPQTHIVFYDVLLRSVYRNIVFYDHLCFINEPRLLH